MSIHLCVIDFYTDLNYSTISEIVNVFEKIDKNIKITVLPYKLRNIVSKIKTLNCNAIILSGSNHRVLKTPLQSLKDVLELDIPLLGICFGYQWMIETLKGTIDFYKDGQLHEYSQLLEISGPFNVAKRKYEFSHHDFITQLPEKWRPIIQYNEQIWMAYRPDKQWIGIQFHPEKHIASGKDFYSKWIKFLLTK